MNTAAVFASVSSCGRSAVCCSGASRTGGRKTTLILSVLMMGGGSLLIVVTPSYARIGVWHRPAAVCRVFQGVGLGGEYGTSATYMSEVAANQRGFFSSFQYVTMIMGQLLAVRHLIVAASALSMAELKAWGWRIPFVIGAILPPGRSACAARGRAAVPRKRAANK